MITKFSISKFFCTAIFLILLFASGVNAQTGFSTPGSTSSANALSIHGIYFGRGAGTASDCINIGTSMASQTSGYYNTSVGFTSLYQVTAGYNNSAFGKSALQNLDSGYKNAGFGSQALEKLTSGYGNTASGHLSGGIITNGIYNSAYGYWSLNNVTTGSFNLGIGYASAVQSATSDYQLSIQNVIYGTDMRAGNSHGLVSIGDFPTATAVAGGLPIGVTARLRLTGYNVGNNASSIPSLQLDYAPYTTTAMTGRYLFKDAAGIVCEAALPSAGNINSCSNAGYIPRTTNAGGNGNMGCSRIFDDGSFSVGIDQTTFGFTTGIATTITPSPAPTYFKLLVNGWVGGTGFTSISDQRLKKDIRKIEQSLDKISMINGYTYNWNKEFKSGRQLDDNRQAGFLAQEIEKVLPEAVVKSSDGIYGLNYNAIMPLLAEGIKEQQEQIKLLQVQNANLESELQKIKQAVSRILPGNVLLKNDAFQVAPNPITGISFINFQLESYAPSAFFVIYDLQGKVIKQMSLPKNEKQGKLQLNKNDFPKGMYIVSLVINAEEVQSKRILIGE